MSPDTVQVTDNFGYYWGPNGSLPQGNGPKHMLGHLEYPQEHDLTTLEPPALYSTTLQY
jgi:hypothetical protein